MPTEELLAVQACALRLLARREHSRLELKRKLLQRHFPRESIELILDELRAKGWQDDRRFAQSYVQTRIASGDGPFKLQMKLRQAGIAEELISQVLPVDDNFWHQQLRRKWAKKCVINQGLALQIKTKRFLQSRGFSLEQIQGFMNSRNDWE